MDHGSWVVWFAFAVSNLITFFVQLSEIASFHTWYVIKRGRLFDNLLDHIAHGYTMLSREVLPMIVREVSCLRVKAALACSYRKLFDQVQVF